MPELAYVPEHYRLTLAPAEAKILLLLMRDILNQGNFKEYPLLGDEYDFTDELCSKLEEMLGGGEHAYAV